MPNMENSELLRQLDQRFQELKNFISNDISNRMEFLFDNLFEGYEIVHDKQWSLEKRVRDLEKQIKQLNDIK